MATTYAVKKGDTFYGLAKKYHGNKSQKAYQDELIKINSGKLPKNGTVELPWSNVPKPKPPKGKVKTSSKKIDSSKKQTAKVKKLITVKKKPCSKCNKFIIVLDPGHGGTKKIGGSSANNATAISGVLEKAMTLSLALKIKNILNDTYIGKYKVQVFLTRSTDVNKTLKFRRSLPKKKKANLYLSLHFNGFHKPKTSGVEIFITKNISKHKTFAQTILDEAYACVNKTYSTPSRGVKVVSYYGAIRTVKCPAALLEGDFIAYSPASDYFSDDANMLTFAKAISEGLKKSAKKLYKVEK